MKEMFVRAMRAEEIKEFGEWIEANRERNLLDPEILTYPTVRVLVAQNGKKVGYLPFHSVLMLESLAPNPEASETERAEACRQFVKSAYTIADSNKFREIYYFGNDPDINRIAERHGFEKIDMPVYRLRVK